MAAGMTKFSSEETLSIARETFDETIEAFKLLKENLSEDFAKAVRLIDEAKKVFVLGVGKSGFIARKIAGTLSSVGLPAFFMHPVEALHGDIGAAKEGDVAILLSKSGSTEEIVRILPFLKAKGLKVISIVGNTRSFLAVHSDAVLNGFVKRESCPLNIAPTTSSLVALALGDALAIAIMKARNFTIEDFARNHPLGQIGKNIALRVKHLAHKGDALPTVEAEESFKNAIIEITRKGLGCVCVVDGSTGKLKGIITDGDVRRTFQKTENIAGLKAKDVMTANPVSIGPEAFLGEALTLMENRPSQISVLPVVEKNGECVGVIRLHDIARNSI